MSRPISRSGSSSLLQAPLLDPGNQSVQRGDSTITVQDPESELLLSDTPRGPDEPTFKQDDYTSLLFNLHAWSYRVQRSEFIYYSQRRLKQLQRVLGSSSITQADIAQTHALTHRPNSIAALRQLRRNSSCHHLQIRRVSRGGSSQQLKKGPQEAAGAAPAAAAAAEGGGGGERRAETIVTFAAAQAGGVPQQGQGQGSSCNGAGAAASVAEQLPPLGPPPSATTAAAAAAAGSGGAAAAGGGEEEGIKDASTKAPSSTSSSQQHHGMRTGFSVHHPVKVRPLEAIKMQKLAGLDKRSSGSGGSGLAALDRAAADAALLSAGLGANSRSASQQQPPAAAAAAGDSGDYEEVGFHDSSDAAGKLGASGACKTTRARSLLGIPMLPATHQFMLVWAVVMLAVDILYTAILLPILAAFEFNQPGEPMFWVSVFFGFLYVVDMLVVLHRGVVVKYLDTYIYVDLPVDVAQLYFVHGQGWPDLVVSLSAPLQLITKTLPQEDRASRHFTAYVNVLVLLRGLRLIKLLMLQQEVVLGRLGLRYLKQRRVWYLYSCCYILAVLLNWLACIMLFIARSEGDPAHSWLASVKGRDLTQASPGRQYIAAMYWMMVTTTTVGYGDVSGGTAVEQVAVIGAVLTGVCFIAYSIKNLMDVWMETAQQDENAQRVEVLKERAHMLRLWGTWQDLPKGLLEKMIEYNSGPWLTHTVLKRSWEGALYDLPPDIKGELLMVTLVERHRELAPVGARLLRGLPMSAGRCLLALLEPRPLAPGHMLCWQGDPATDIWLLQDGELVTLVGILPEGQPVSQPGLLVTMDLRSWIQERQLQQEGSGAVPPPAPGLPPRSASSSRRNSHQHHPFDASQQLVCGACAGTGRVTTAAGGAGVGQGGSGSSWKYNSSMQATIPSFLWVLPLNRLALALTCMPELGEHLIEELQLQEDGGF